MSTYVSDFIRRTIPIPNLKETALRAATSSNRSSVTVAINKFINQLSNEIPITDQIVSSLVNVMEYIPLNDDITINNFDSESDVDMTATISNQAAESLFDDLNIIAQNGVLAISDSDGYPYELILSRDSSGHKVIKTTPNPESFRDYFIYYDHEIESYRINGILKSLGFYRRSDVYVHPKDALGACLLHADYVDYSGDANTIQEFVCDFAGVERNTPIKTALDSLCVQLHIQPCDTILQALQSICILDDSAYSRINYGIKRTASRVIHDISANATMNDMLVKVGTLVCNGLNDVSILSNQIQDYLTSSLQSVKELANNLTNAFILGGWYGLAMYLIDIMRGVASIKAEEGKLSFTDNASQVPLQYIAGVVTKVIGSVVAMAGAILAAMQPAIGVIVSLIGSIVGAIPLAINYDYTKNTLAGVIESDGLILPYSPLAFFQDEFKADWTWIDILHMCQQQACLFYFDVPGGCILCGASDKEDFIRVEFHPSCILNRFQGQFPCFTIKKQVGTYYEYYYAVRWLDISRDSLEMYWRAQLESPKIASNSFAGVLSEEDDKALRIATMSHVGLFALWLLNFGALGNNPEKAQDYVAVHVWNDYPLEHKGTMAFGLSWGDCLNMFLHHSLDVDSDNCEWTDLANAAVKMSKDRTFTYHLFEVNQVDHTLTGNSVTLPANTGWSLNLLPAGNFSRMLSEPQAVNNFSYFFVVPKYDRSTFLSWVVFSVAVVAVATVATVVASVKIKRWRARKRAKLTTAVSNAWESYGTAMKDYDPSDEDDDPSLHTEEARKEAYKTYFKAVKKNNRWANILGGSKYSLAGYWDCDPEPSPDDEEVVDSGAMLDYSQTSDDSELPLKPKDDSDYGSIETVLRLIRGS